MLHVDMGGTKWGNTINNRNELHILEYTGIGIGSKLIRTQTVQGGVSCGDKNKQTHE